MYETNTDNIREAQKSVQDAQYNITKNQLQEQIDALNDQLDEYNDKVDEQLEALDKIKEKWSEIAENITKAQNALVADQYIGTGWKDKVLSGNDNDIYTAFKNQYEVNAAQIKKYEEQINSTEKIQTLLNEYITAYKEGQISYDAAQSAIQGLLSQLNQTMTASANISNVMAYEKLLNNASGTNSEEILKSIQGNLSESGLTLLKSLEQYKNNQSLISFQTSTWEQLNNNVAEMLSVLKDVRTALKNTERDDDDDDSSSSKSSKNTSKSGGPGKSSWSNVDENNGPGAEINRKKAGLAHSGLEAGVVGGATSSDKTTQLKWLGLRELDPDEYPYILRAGEQVINEDQRKTLLSNLNNMFDIGSRNSLAVASKITGNNSTSSPNVNVQIDKIVMPDVTDADGFAKSLYNNLELSFSQQFSKLR